MVLGLFGSIGVAVIALLVFVILLSLYAYAKLARLDGFLHTSWDNIQLLIEKRYNSIPDLVLVVKQYGIHEKELIEEVVSMRLFSMGIIDIEKKAEAEFGVKQALQSLFNIAENYPDLKVNKKFLALQEELQKIEKALQLERKKYNKAAGQYNSLISTFPSNMVANFAKFIRKPYFKANKDELIR